MSAPPTGLPLDFAGHAMRRWKHRAEQELITYIGAIETAYRAIHHLASGWPMTIQLTAEADIATAERDVVWAIICKHAAVVSRHREMLRELWVHEQALLDAVRHVPTWWDADRTAELMRQPWAFGLTTEDTEDLETERARGTPWPSPPSPFPEAAL